MQIPGAGEKGRDSSNFVAAEDAGRLADNASDLLEKAVGVEWYRQHGTDVDRATLNLCRLRRARAGERGGPGAGDEAVRAVLSTASPAARSGSRAARSRIWTRAASRGSRAVVP